MAFALVLSGAAERDALIQKDIVPDFRGLADDDAVAVVNKKTPSDLCPGVDLNAGGLCRKLRNSTCYEKMPVRIGLVGNSIRPDSMQTRIQEQHLSCGPCGGVAPFAGLHILSGVFQYLVKFHSVLITSGQKTSDGLKRGASEANFSRFHSVLLLGARITAGGRTGILRVSGSPHVLADAFRRAVCRDSFQPKALPLCGYRIPGTSSAF